MPESVLLYQELTGKIIGYAMKVHRHFGPGFPEGIYQKALLLELKSGSILCREEVSKDIYYLGEKIGRRRLDIIVENKILLELKARKDWNGNFNNQLVNYLRVFNIEVGLLINFSGKSLEFNRILNTLNPTKSV